MPQWRIYYGDGSTFDSHQGADWEAPPLDVQAIVQVDKDPHGTGRMVVSPFPFYWYEDGEWYGGDLFGLFDYLMRSGLVKFGRTRSNETFKACMKRATDDPDFLPLARTPA